MPDDLNADGRKTRTHDIGKCARCGRDHSQLQFIELLIPQDEFQYWAMCPITGEPILMQVIPDFPTIPCETTISVGNGREDLHV